MGVIKFEVQTDEVGVTPAMDAFCREWIGMPLDMMLELDFEYADGSLVMRSSDIWGVLLHRCCACVPV